MRTLTLGGLPAGARTVVRRAAVRAVVESERGLLLLRTPSTGDLKLPGGGVEVGEDAEAALRREVAEECGCVVGSVGPCVLLVVERRADAHDPRDGFEMTSAYHRVSLTGATVPRGLDDYEAALALEPVWLAADDAVAVLDEVLRAGSGSPWTVRERAVLQLVAAGGLGPRS